MPLHPFLVKSKLYKPLRFFTKPFSRLNEYLDFLNWVDKHNAPGAFNDYYNTEHNYQRRYELHEHIITTENLEKAPVNYYEFGVAAGEMIRFWAKHNTHEGSLFFGFDSFEGLPEDWENKGKGHFDENGQTPDIDDIRVSFIKGWFQETVHGFFSQHVISHRSIFHLDADLFSSTLYVLFHLRPFLKKGDILIFDEFSSYRDEYKAMKIFQACFGKPLEYRLIGAINNYRQVAFELL